ncbi:MAG TPA: EamA family transporter, partial [Hyphomicrobiaceae bacterium]|nr:EamA family transporter [Hyphomicrobiaceae bacterium]
MAQPSPAPLTVPHYPVSGWVEAGLYVFAIGFLSLTYVVGHQLGAHPIAFILYAMTVSALVLLAVTGLGEDALAVILAPHSWLVGIGTIAMEVFYYQLLEYVPPALGSLLVRLTIPLSMVVGWSLFGRRPARPALLGAGIICAGIVPMLFTSAPGAQGSVVALAFASACAYALRGFSAEFHPWNRAARTVREKLRITGLVVLVTSVAGLALAAFSSVLISAGVMPATSVVPTTAQMLHVPT